MDLRYGFNNAKDLLSKLKRDISLLDEQVTGDRFFNFIITAYHLLEWIKNDESLSLEVRNEVECIYDNKYFIICHDIANASKHFELLKPPKTQSAVSNQGWGCGRYGKGAWGVGEESIDIVCSDGTKINALTLSQEILKMWESFFTKNGI
ncbi:MAG: hypothetical protein JW969_12555 [Spirochaetales bacterium]|nr:hypothetical protein [Spirochaetales bacterium]